MSNEPNLDNVWGHIEIAKVIGRTPRQAHYMLAQNALPARKVNGRWVASRETLRTFFASGSMREPNTSTKASA